jgi:hypothetical protein
MFAQTRDQRSDTSGGLRLVQTVTLDTTATAAVVIDAETLFVVGATIRGSTVQQRADIIARRIVELAESYVIRSDDIATAVRPDATEIYGQDRFIMGVYDVDALLAGTTRDSSRGSHHRAVVNAGRSSKSP